MARGNTEPLDFEALRLNRINAELTAKRRKLAGFKAGVWGLMAGTLVLAVATMTAAADTVRAAALATKTFEETAATLLEPLLGMSIILLMLTEALIREARLVPPASIWRTRWFCAVASLLTNCVPSLAMTRPLPGGGYEWAPNWGGAGLHLIVPGLLVAFTELTPKARALLMRALAAFSAEEKQVIEGELERRENAAAEARRVEQENADAEHRRTVERQQAERQARDADAQRVRWDREDTARRDREAVELQRQVAEGNALIQERLILAQSKADQEAAAAAADRDRAAAERARAEADLKAREKQAVAGRRNAGAGTGEKAGRPATEKAGNTVYERTLEMIREESITKADIAQELGVHPDSVEKALGQLRREGKAEPDPTMPRGWRVPPLAVVAAQ